jgi:hypothetical protein
MDVEFVVSYNQAKHWLKTQKATDNVFPRTYAGGPIGGSAYAAINEGWNGMMTIHLLNVLSTPGNSGSVGLQIFMSGSPSLEFAYPFSHTNDTWSYFTIQSGNACSMNSGSENPDSDAYAVYHGEVIRSMRTLMHRTTRASPIFFGETINTDIIHVGRFIQPVFPTFRGYDPNGFQRVNKYGGGGIFPFNREGPSVYQLLVPCFVGMRGSIQWHFAMQVFGQDPQVLNVARSQEPLYQDSLLAPRYDSVGSSVSTDVSVLEQYWFEYEFDEMAGVESTHGKVMPTMTLSVPFYSQYRFAATKPDSISGVDVLGSAERRLKGVFCRKRSAANDYSIPNTVIERFFETGPDFTMFFFHGVPTMYVYDNVPVSVPYSTI